MVCKAVPLRDLSANGDTEATLFGSEKPNLALSYPPWRSKSGRDLHQVPCTDGVLGVDLNRNRAGRALIFRKWGGLGWDWDAWDNDRKSPVGIAAFAAFLVGWAGSVLCMAQVWYLGPIAAQVGEYGADMGILCRICLGGHRFSRLEMAGDPPLWAMN